MPPGPEPILDYASPRKRTRLRLPARSILVCNIDRDQIKVTESLSGKEGAAAAIVFACVTLATLAMAETSFHIRLREVVDFLPFAVGLAEVVVMLMVIQQTWRTTLLTVRYNEMELSFSSAFHRRHYRWTGQDILDLLLVETANTQTAVPLAELLITRSAGGDIRLFTDHRAEEIERLVAILPPMLRSGEPTPMQTTAVVPPMEARTVDPIQNAMEASSRLVDVHRNLRNKS